MLELMQTEWTAAMADWLQVLAQPMMAIPLFGAWAFSYVYSRTPRVQLMKRKTDREFVIYRSNATVSALLFIATNYDQDPRTLVSLTILVAAASVAVPWLYFKKNNRN